MFKLDLSKFKKIGRSETHTELRHPAGHTIKIAHVPLKPHVKRQLDALPMHEGGDPTQERLTIGDSIPNKIEKEVVNKSKKELHFEDGGDVPKPQSSPEPDKTLEQTFATAGSDSDKGKAGRESIMHAFAEGGQIGFNAIKKENYKGKKIQYYADGGMSENSSQQPSQDSADQIIADVNQAAAGQQPQAQTQQQVPQNPIDPDIERKRQIYNAMVHTIYGGSFGGSASGNMPAAAKQNIEDASFGPNGEAPKKFDASIFNRYVVPQFNAEKAQQSANDVSAQMKIQQENAAKQQLGILPAPQANTGPNPASDNSSEGIPGLEGGEELENGQIPGQAGDQELDKLQQSNPQSSGSISRQPQSQATQPEQPQLPPSPTQKAMTPQQAQQQHADIKKLGYDTLTNERNAFVDDLQNQHIAPETLSSLFAKKSTLGKMATMAGLMLGGVGAAGLHEQNPVLTAMNNEIDNDLKAQTLELGKKENLLSNNLQMFGNLPDALKFSKINMMDAQLHQLVSLANKFPNNPKIQQQLQAARMAGAVSSQNLMDNIATNQAYMTMMQSNPEGAAQAAALNGDQKTANLIANRVVTSPQGSSGSMLPYLDNEARQATVKGPNGRYYNTGSAANAKEYNDQVTAYQPLMADLNELSSLNTIGNRMSPAQRARSQSLMGHITTELNALAKSNRISEADIGFEKSQLSNPSAMSTILSGNAATQQLQRSLSRKMSSVAQQYIPGYQPVAFKPAR